MAVLWVEMRGTEENGQTVLSSQESYSNSNNHSIQPWAPEKYLKMHSTSNLEATTAGTNIGFLSGQPKQESEAIVGTHL